MAGGGRTKIKGGIASKGEAVVSNGCLNILLCDGNGNPVTGMAQFEAKFYGEDGGSGVTTVNLMEENDDDMGVLLVKARTTECVGVVFRHTNVPGMIGDWTLDLKKYDSGSDSFLSVATFTVPLG